MMRRRTRKRWAAVIAVELVVLACLTVGAFTLGRLALVAAGVMPA